MKVCAGPDKKAGEGCNDADRGCWSMQREGPEKKKGATAMEAMARMYVVMPVVKGIVLHPCL